MGGWEDVRVGGCEDVKWLGVGCKGGWGGDETLCNFAPSSD